MCAAKKTYLVGVGLGGTNVRAGLVQNGKIIALEARPHPPKANAEAIIDEICQTIAKVLRPGASGIALSRQSMKYAANSLRQGPWNVDLRTPPGPEGSNGSLLDICRGHPGVS